MHLAVQALVVGLDPELTGTVQLHGHSRIESAVVLVELLVGAGLVNFRHMGADDAVIGPGGQKNTGTGGGVRLAALIYIIKNHGRGHPADDLRVVQDQHHRGGGVVLGVFAQIHGDLAQGELAREPVDAGTGNVDHGMGGGLLGGMGLPGFALAVVLAAACLIINNVVGHMDAGIFGEFHALIRQPDQDLPIGGRGRGLNRPGGLRRPGSAARQHRQRQQQTKQFFHNIRSFRFSVSIIPYLSESRVKKS